MTQPSITTLPINIPLIHSFLRSCQQDDGAIRWFDSGKLDPWDHTEAAMALSIIGDLSNAKRAYRWLRKHQAENGSWQANYFSLDNSAKIETNFVAYPVTGLWHYFLITGDREFLNEYFFMAEKAIAYVLKHQNPEGDIQWATSKNENLPKDALITACSSILRSLECGINIANTLKRPKPQWQTAYHKLADALLNRPWRFDRTWESKARYSMDWFYPILAGIYSQSEAKLRLQKRWHEFVEDSLGCRCVSDEPWITVAESCELVMACAAAGEGAKAETIFKWLAQWQDSDGGYWTGYSFRDKAIWPQEKTSWTAAAMLLAADALYGITEASGLFTSRTTLHTN